MQIDVGVKIEGNIMKNAINKVYKLLQSIVNASFFELMVKYDNVNDPQPRPHPPNPAFARKYERAKERWRAQGWRPVYKRAKMRPDEEFM